MPPKKVRKVAPAPEEKEDMKGPEEKKIRISDPVQERLDFKLTSAQKMYLKEPINTRKTKKLDLAMGRATFYEGVDNFTIDLSTPTTPADLDWPANLQNNYKRNRKSMANPADHELFNMITNYLDVSAVVTNKDYRDFYVGHMLNQLINTRNQIVKNIKSLRDPKNVTEEMIEKCRDQGFVRPTCLILCPFKKDALDIMQRLISMLYGSEPATIMNKSRFDEEFISDGVVDNALLDDDLKELMSGNNEDSFRLGVAISKKALKLFEPFENADILLCSPLGLRMILEQDDKDESHFVSSLQMVVVDSADVILQQNFENLHIIFDKLHLLPKHIISDISRVRSCYLEGDGSHYSQLLMFSQYQHELFVGLMLRQSANYRGLVVHQPKQEGKLSKIEIPLCQELLRFSVENASDPSQARLNFFIKRFGNCLVENTCIVVPSYFDFVRLRNHFKRQEESFVSCHEYAEPRKIKRARDMFFHKLKKVLLVTERFHFYQRKHIKGIERLIFYQIPSHPNFYHEFINMGKLGQTRFSSSLIYCKHDRLRLNNTFGTDMTKSILSSEKSVQAIVSE